MIDKDLQFLEQTRRLPRTLPVDIRVISHAEPQGTFEPREAGEQAGRCMDCGNPYCQWQCPLHNNIPHWLRLVEQGRVQEAARWMYETNPLPEICGRVCPQDRLCEGACTLEETRFGAVTIGSIERWATDEAILHGWLPDLSGVPASGFRGAVVGAGPAGLSCADRLRHEGMAVDVYDRYPEIGGLLTYGIPSFKLDKAVVKRRRQILENLGVCFHLGVEIGADLPFENLLAEYDAVFIGTGAYTYVEGEIPGAQFEGVHDALPFLIASIENLLNHTPIPADLDVQGKRVVVLGGGDTAMDCNRTAIRRGAASVTCVYRRGEADMPGSAREVAYSREEGVNFRFHRQPLAIHDHKGRVAAIRLGRTAPGGGRGSAGTLSGDEEIMPTDLVIKAFGFRPSPAPWCTTQGIALDAAGRVRVAEDRRLPGQTSHPKVFAGGDNVRGADLVVRAVYDGREAAAAMVRYLKRA